MKKVGGFDQDTPNQKNEAEQTIKKVRNRPLFHIKVS